MDVFGNSGLTRQEFADRLKISPAVLSHISSGRNQPSLDLILSLLQAYPDISPDWMLMGKGSMKRSAGAMPTEPISVQVQIPLPETSREQEPVAQPETPKYKGIPEITDVNESRLETESQKKEYQEALLAMRIALQMHQTWMEQQLLNLEKRLDRDS